MSEGFHRDYRASEPKWMTALILRHHARGETWFGFRTTSVEGQEGWVASYEGGSPGVAMLEGAVETESEASARVLAYVGQEGLKHVNPLCMWTSPLWQERRYCGLVLCAEWSERFSAEGWDWFREADLPRQYRSGLLEKALGRGDDPSGLRWEDTTDSPVEAESFFPVHSGVQVWPLRTPTLPPATHTNCVVAGGGKLVVIDPASPYEEEQERLAECVAQRIQRGERLERVLLTHHHGDHVGGVKAFCQRFDVPVAAHPETRRLLQGIVAVDEDLMDGDRVAYGDGAFLTALHTPGHAPGHLVFYDRAGGWMMAGDMVAGQGTIVIDPPLGSMGTYIEQLRRLIVEGPDRIVASHGPLIVEPKLLLEHYIRHRFWREDRIHTFLNEAGPSRVDQVVSGIYQDVVPAALPIAARQTLAHLEHLEEQGRVSRLLKGKWAVCSAH